MPGGGRKGFPFERKIAVAISLWLTNGQRDDTVWRTDGSGGRSTNRRKQGKSTHGQAGDLTYTDALVKPFFDQCHIECKRGYGKWSPFDVVDKRPDHKPQVLQMWIEKAEMEAEQNGIPYVLIIIQRDQRVPIVFLPRVLLRRLMSWFGRLPRPRMSVRLDSEQHGYYYAMPLQAFFDWADPEYFLGKQA